jgi:uncharacterized protein
MVLLMHPEVERLSASKYLLVTTFRKDGTTVPTPVWVVRDGDQLAVWTPTTSHKVRRIRANPRVRLAPCDFRGNPIGDEVTGTARLLDAAGSKRIRRLIGRRYGIVGRLIVLGSILRRGQDGTLGIALTIDSVHSADPTQSDDVEPRPLNQ